MPDIDKRSFEEILSDNRLTASLYVPEWKPLDESDLGVALIKIFSHMQEDINSRLNRVPDKAFTSFLDMIGLELMPAQPAAAPVTFSLAQGQKESVLVPAGTQVAAAKTESHEALTFETAKDFTAIKATISRIYSINPEEDAIYSHWADYRRGRPFAVFEGENIQKHILYLGHSTLFKLKEQRPISIRMVLDEGSGEEDIKSWKWSRPGGDPFVEVRVERISPVEAGFAMIKGSARENSYRITLLPDAVVEENSISGISSLWIECRMDTVTAKSRPVTIKKILLEGASSDSTLDPDLAFYNFLPLDLGQKFYPFGMQPRLYDTFYLSSEEAFSKKKARITITFEAEKDGKEDPDKNILISWEYWNGSIWQVLKMEDKDNTVLDFKLPSSKGYIKFNRPDDMSAFEVNGAKGYWIRARLVNGSYGWDKIESYSVGQQTFFKVVPAFSPPWADSVKISYRLTEESCLEHCLSNNNNEFRDVTALCQGKGFRPFLPLPESSPALYIGLNEPLLKGNLSFYFSLIEEEQISSASSEVIWSTWTPAPSLLKMENKKVSQLLFASTEGLGAGTELLIEEDFLDEKAAETARISAVRSEIENSGKTSKIVELDRRLEHLFTTNARVLKRTRLDAIDGTERLSRSGILELLGPADHQKTARLGDDLYWLMGATDRGRPSLIRGIYPNTVLAMQMESIKDEILGSSGGQKDSHYIFVRRPVISLEVWVREGAAVIDPGLEVQEVTDSSGKVIDAWVKWHEVEDFYRSGPRDRHYTLDGANGELYFGDGLSGMIPPIGRDNIKASYRSGGGAEGNVDAGEINAIKTPVAGIDRIRNYLPSEGGSDTESIESVFERGPYVVRTLDRAVTGEDFERLAAASSSYVARARVLVSGSKLKVIVVPKGVEERPMPSSGLLRIVREYLLKRSLSTVSANRLDVIGPDYKEVRVRVDVIPESIDLAVSLERSILIKLKEFLHPLSGGPAGKGWDFGRPVRISDIYSILERTEGVDHVEDLRLNDSAGDVDMGASQLACTGEHTVNIRLGERP